MPAPGRAMARWVRVFTIALARRLPVALWRYATTGVAPDDAALA